MEKPPKYKVVVTHKASIMLEEHVRFLTRVSIPAAKKLHKDFKEAVVSLSEMPERCGYFAPEEIPKQTYRRLVLDGRYLIVFQIIGNMVAILEVLDGRQDWLSNLDL